MEIAESSAQNLVAVSDFGQSLFVLSLITYSDGQMLRRLRRAFPYRRSKYSSVGPELDNKWHHWVEQQSFKRYELGYIMENQSQLIPTCPPDSSIMFFFTPPKWP